MTSEPDCDHALERIYHYLDGELTLDIRESIRHHLDDCPPCGKVFQFETELKQLIARGCQEQAPESLRRRIAEALNLDPPSLI